MKGIFSAYSLYNNNASFPPLFRVIKLFENLSPFCKQADDEWPIVKALGVLKH